MSAAQIHPQLGGIDPNVVICDGAAHTLQPPFDAYGLIISNGSDVVVRVRNSRGDEWAAPPGGTLKRPIITPDVVYYVQSDHTAHQGSCLVTFTRQLILEVEGADASLTAMFRRTVVEGFVTGIAGDVLRKESFDVQTARYAQLELEFILTDAANIALTTIAIYEQLGVPTAYREILSFQVPSSPTLFTAMIRMGRGGDIALPALPSELWIDLNMVAPSGGAIIIYRIQAWEGES